MSIPSKQLAHAGQQLQDARMLATTINDVPDEVRDELAGYSTPTAPNTSRRRD